MPTHEDEKTNVSSRLSTNSVRQSLSQARNQFAPVHMFKPHDLSPIKPGALTFPFDLGGDGRFDSHAADGIAAGNIISKASSLGYTPEDALGGLNKVSSGYFQRYPNHDIYYVPEVGTFEVHGDIRAKYNALGGANGELGVPHTDEQGTSDNVGRYNHFKGGSIYWTPHTGPMAIRGRVRTRWADTGWERGPLGYPVQDQHHMVNVSPSVPKMSWCRFENGVIAGDDEAWIPSPNINVGEHSVDGSMKALDAPAALITNEELAGLVGAKINAKFKESPDNVGLRPGVERLGVGEWSYDFWSSHSRPVGFRLRGFHDNGLAPDTDFVIDIWLRFETASASSLTEPTHKTLIAVLDFVRVKSDGGLPLAEVNSGVANAIHKAFFPEVWPDPLHSEVPTGAIYIADIPTGADVNVGTINILDVFVGPLGDLSFFVNPLPPPGDTTSIDWGQARKNLVQTNINMVINT